MDAILQTLARELERSPEHVQNVATLIDEGATIPFIARYRKELHGSIDVYKRQSVPSGYAWIPDTECPVSYRAAIFFPVRPRTSRQEAGANTSTWSPKERRKPSSHPS